MVAAHLLKEQAADPVVYVNPPGARLQFERYAGPSIGVRRFDFNSMTEFQPVVDVSGNPFFLLGYARMDTLFLSQGLNADIRIIPFLTRRMGHDLYLHRISSNTGIPH